MPECSKWWEVKIKIGLSGCDVLELLKLSKDSVWTRMSLRVISLLYRYVQTRWVTPSIGICPHPCLSTTMNRSRSRVNRSHHMVGWSLSKECWFFFLCHLLLHEETDTFAVHWPSACLWLHDTFWSLVGWSLVIAFVTCIMRLTHCLSAFCLSMTIWHFLVSG